MDLTALLLSRLQFAFTVPSRGTTFSAFWIMVNNSQMQAPVGHAIENGVLIRAKAATTGITPSPVTSSHPKATGDHHGTGYPNARQDAALTA